MEHEHQHWRRRLLHTNEEITARVKTIDPALLHEARRTHHDLGMNDLERTRLELYDDHDELCDEALTPPRGYRPKQIALQAPPIVRQRQPSVSLVVPPPPSSANIHTTLPVAVEDVIDPEPTRPRERTDPMRTILLLPPLQTPRPSHRAPSTPPPAVPARASAPVRVPIPIMRPPPLSDSVSTVRERVAHPPPSSSTGTFLLVVTAVIATAVAITLIIGSAPGMKRRFSYVQLERLERELDVDAAIFRPAFFVRAGRVHLTP